MKCSKGSPIYRKNNIQLRILKSFCLPWPFIWRSRVKPAPTSNTVPSYPKHGPSPPPGPWFSSVTQSVFLLLLYFHSLEPSSQIQYSEPTQGTSMGLTSSDPCVLGAPITNVWQHLQAGGRPLTVQPGLLEKSKANWPVWELNLRPWLHYHLVKTIEPLSR